MELGVINITILKGTVFFNHIYYVTP